MNTTLVNLGPFAWKGNPAADIPPGHWQPTGQPSGQFRFKNPVQWVRGRLLSARIFVGLYVNGKPRWSKRDLVDLVKQVWGHEASFISQDGLWTNRGKLKPEKSVQVVLLNLDGNGNPICANQQAWETATAQLADTIRKKFKQKLVVLDVQANGRTIGTGLAT